jgi:hypothetical protein
MDSLINKEVTPVRRNGRRIVEYSRICCPKILLYMLYIT